MLLPAVVETKHEGLRKVFGHPQPPTLQAAPIAPMHINDLHAAFVARGLQIPGSGRPNNITVHLAGSSQIESVSRGVYALKSEGEGAAALR